MTTICAPELIVRAAGLQLSEVARASPGELVTNLQEDTSYVLEVSAGDRRLFVDDIPLTDVVPGQFTWTSSFYAGRVEVVSVAPAGEEISYFLDVVPAGNKVREDQFASMTEAIRQFDERLLLGETSACLGFGSAGSGGRFDKLVRWERMRKHGRAFLRCVDAVINMPHANLRPVRQSLSLARIKSIPVAALRDKRIVALATGQLLEDESIQSIQVNAQVPVATVDTPANRAICALLKRFQQALVELRAWAMEKQGELSDAEAIGRCRRRLGIIGAYEADVRRMLNCHPFRSIRKPHTSAAGLTQIAANPIYARAYRIGTDILRLGVMGVSKTEYLHVSPSWGVYETWCYIALIEALEARTGVEFKPGKTKFAEISPDLVLIAQLPDGRLLELLFQATFRSRGLDGTNEAWSLSKERRPDIVLVASQGEEYRTLVLDAKYRSGISNVLDAMTSAHIYHDSLFLAGRRPDACLLLLPGEPEVVSLERRETWAAYGVGTISNYSVGKAGVQRCVDAVLTYLLKSSQANTSSNKSGS